MLLSFYFTSFSVPVGLLAYNLFDLRFFYITSKQEKAVICKPHNYRRNGCTALVFSRDSQHIVTVGDQSTINCWNWESVMLYTKTT